MQRRLQRYAIPNLFVGNRANPFPLRAALSAATHSEVNRARKNFENFEALALESTSQKFAKRSGRNGRKRERLSRAYA